MELKSTCCRGLKTSWLEGGSPGKPILLLLHGYPDSPEAFSQQIEAFAKDFHIVAPYVRGCGPSEPGQSIARYRIDSLAMDVLEILQTVDSSEATRITVIGHDLGVPLAWRLLSFLGSRADRMVMMNGLSLRQMYRRLGQLSQHGKSWYIYLFQLPKVLPTLFRLSPRFFKKRMLALGGHYGAMDTNEKAHATLVHPAKQYRAFAKDLLRSKTFDASDRCHVPLLILWGKNDPFLTIPTLEELEKDASKVEVRILNGSHWMHRDDPSLINRLLRQFIVQSRNELREPQQQSDRPLALPKGQRVFVSQNTPPS